MKVLASQLSRVQADRLLDEIPATLYPTEHYLVRAEEKGVNYSEALFAVSNGEFIEFNTTQSGERRMLMRSEDGICVVVELGTGNLVTCYRNDSLDNHEGLDETRYWQGPVTNGILSLTTVLARKELV
jgi:hypothetical protein